MWHLCSRNIFYMEHLFSHFLLTQIATSKFTCVAAVLWQYLDISARLTLTTNVAHQVHSDAPLPSHHSPRELLCWLILLLYIGAFD